MTGRSSIYVCISELSNGIFHCIFPEKPFVYIFLSNENSCDHENLHIYTILYAESRMFSKNSETPPSLKDELLI